MAIATWSEPRSSTPPTPPGLKSGAERGRGGDTVSPKESLVPSGTVDNMPTILHVLGYDMLPWVEGRILVEALAAVKTELAPFVATHTYSTEMGTPTGLYLQ